MIVHPPQYNWLINEETSDGDSLSDETGGYSVSGSTSDPLENPNMTRSLLNRGQKSSQGNEFKMSDIFGIFSSNSVPNRGEYTQVSHFDTSESDSREYWDDESKIWFDKENIGTASYKVENFLVNITITYWKGSTIPTDRSETYYIKKMKCFFFSTEMSKTMKRELLEVDNRTHQRLVNFYERQLEGCSFPNLIRELFGLEKQYSKS